MSFTPSARKVTAELQARGWTVAIAAVKADLSEDTIGRMKAGHSVRGSSALKLQKAFEQYRPRLADLMEASA